MSCSCNCNKKICPFGFGLALGLAGALAIVVQLLYAAYLGPTAWAEMMHANLPTFSQGALITLMVFVKATIFGFVLILIYNGLVCLKSMCCKKSAKNCGCESKVVINKPEDMK